MTVCIERSDYSQAFCVKYRSGYKMLPVADLYPRLFGSCIDVVDLLNIHHANKLRIRRTWNGI